MPGLVAWVISGLTVLFRSKIGSWFAAALLFFGIELATSAFVVEPLRDYVVGAFAGMPATVLEWAGFLQIDRYISIIFSAYVAAFSAGAAGRVFLRRKAA